MPLPYMEQDNVYRGYETFPLQPYNGGAGTSRGPHGNIAIQRLSRHTPIATMQCPSDSGPFGNELFDNTYGFMRGNYKAITGSGDMYGNLPELQPAVTPNPFAIGVYGVTRGDPVTGQVAKPRMVKITSITDGTSNTVSFSEGIQPQTANWGGPIGNPWFGNMGGGLMTTTLTPNSTVPDQIYGPCPGDNGDASYKAPCKRFANNGDFHAAERAHAAARSFHSGGVNTGMTDGSVRFFRNSIDLATWRAFGTMANGEVISDN